MSERAELRAEFADLIFRLREGALGANELERLNNWLVASPEHRAAYLEMLTVLAGLAWTRGENDRPRAAHQLSASSILVRWFGAAS